MTPEEQLPAPAQRSSDANSLATLVYILQAAAFFIGITYIAAVVVNYVKRADVTGTVAESHFRWQIRTFWFSLLWATLGTLTFAFVLGYFILLANAVWVIYRIVKGWLYLRDNKTMYPA
jgi:uncharacterized membrane protein